MPIEGDPVLVCSDRPDHCPVDLASGFTAEVAPCQTDDDCYRMNYVCDPDSRFADALGCRPPLCTEPGFACPEAWFCDVDSEGAWISTGTPVAGCRGVRCDLQGIECPEGSNCVPESDAESNGCVPNGCSTQDDCETGYVCNVEGHVCQPIPCSEPDGVTCSAGSQCDPDADGSGCVKIPCSEPDGEDCATGFFCDGEGALPRCLPFHCSDPEGLPCQAGDRCDPNVGADGCIVADCFEDGAKPCVGGVCNTMLAPGAFDRGCKECAVDTDCGCGACVAGICFKGPGWGVAGCE
jgi:hypothetical protein